MQEPRKTEDSARRLPRFLPPALVIACLLSAAGLLSLHLAADAPPDASGSAGLHFDAPSKCHNARNAILFGEWVIDEWTPFIHSPAQTILQAGVFSVLGSGTVQMRILSVLASLLSLWLLFVLIRRDCGYGIALVALIAFTLNVDFWVYGRSGLLEPLVILGMLATLWTLRNGYRAAEEESPLSRVILWFAATALLGMAALLSKVISVYFLVSVALMVCLFPPRRKISLAVLFGVFGILLAVYLGPFMRINAQYFARESGYWAERAGSSDHLKLWLTQPLFFTLKNTSALTHLAAIALCFVFFGLRDREKRQRRIVPAIMALTFIAGSQFLSVVSYRPQRYYVPLLAPIAFLAATSIHRLFLWISDEELWRRPAFGRCVAAFLALTFLLSLSPLGPIRLIDKRIEAIALSPGERMAATAGVVLLAILAWLAIRGVVRKGLSRIPLRMRTWSLVLCLLLALGAYARKSTHPYRHWAKNARYGMRDFGMMLGERYHDMHIAGTTPLFAVIDNKHHAYKVTAYDLNWRVMTNGTVTHAIIPTQFGHRRFFRNTFSNMMGRATPVDRVTIGPHPHILYAFDLKPLQQEIATEENVEALLSLANPDEHTPQTRTLIIPGATAEPGLIESREFDLLPGASASQRFSSADGLERALIVPREAWNEGRDGWTEATRIREATDSKAWEVDAILLRPSRRGDKESAFAMRSSARGAPVFAGARLRGDLKDGDVAFIEWVSEGEVIISKTITAARLTSGAYTPFILSLGKVAPDPNGSLRVRFVGKGKVHVDALLFLDKPDAERFRCCRTTGALIGSGMQAEGN